MGRGFWGWGGMGRGGWGWRGEDGGVLAGLKDGGVGEEEWSV